MSKKEVVKLPGDSYSRIKLFLSPTETGIVLTAKEEEMLKRFVFANGMLSEKKWTRNEIAAKIKEVHGVSYWTALHDINTAYTLYHQVTEDYKRYTLVNHVEDIDKLIQQWSKDKSMAPYLVKLFEAKTKAIQSIPVQLVNPDVPAPVINVSVVKNTTIIMNKDEAIDEADKLIQFEKDHEYLDEIKDDSDNTKSE
jgi:hypothetical protein